MNPAPNMSGIFFQRLRGQVHTLNYAGLLLIGLLTYWPLSLGIFPVKNDAIHYFLPFRFHVSEAIRNGEWPFWSPYLYNGFPLAGDMQSGAWNPVVWFLSLFSRYDLTVFHIETLLYIFLAGAGMYRLVHLFTKDTRTSFLTGTAYMLSGFMLSGQLINWLAAAAFIPIVLLFYIRLLREFNYTLALKTGCSLYLLFTSAYPSFFLLTGYLLAALALFRLLAWIRLPGSDKTSWVKPVLVHGLLLFVFITLSLPAILSFADLLPYYQRGNGISYTEASTNSFNWRYLVSLFFPSAISQQYAGVFTDPNFRNLYMGIIPVWVLAVTRPAWNKTNRKLLTGAALAFFLSLGSQTPLHEWFYKLIPLADRFRHPAQFRLFLLLFLLLLAAPGLKQLLSGELTTRRHRWYRNSLMLSVVLLFICTVLLLLVTDTKNLSGSIPDNISRVSLRELIRKTDNPLFILANGFIQLLTITSLLLWLKRGRPYRFFSLIWIGNLFLIAQLLLPYSFVSSRSVSSVNQFIRRQPAGFPAELSTGTLAENSRDLFSRYDELSLTGFYTKKPTICTLTYNPSFLTRMEEVIRNPEVYNRVASKPLAYLSHEDNREQGSVKVVKMGANRFILQTSDSTGSSLMLTQNWFPYWQAKINGKPAEIVQSNISFMSLPLPPGKHTVEFMYRPLPVLNAIPAMISMFVLLSVTGLYQLFRKKESSVK